MRRLPPHYRRGSRSEAGKCAFHFREEGGAARRGRGVDVVEGVPLPLAGPAQPAEPAEQHRPHRVAQDQLDEPPPPRARPPRNCPPAGAHRSPGRASATRPIFYLRLSRNMAARRSPALTSCVFTATSALVSYSAPTR